ncbi:MAG: DNA polymerase IV [Gemmatimonadetes bacterium]|nr:MAG: DNA polymerase IV [Gemmatimonadota bacterium]
MTTLRKIIHIDMDAFYPSVEILDHPELTGKPVIVGGRPEHRGVVASANYEARKFGVHSAMPAATAKRLCPHAIFIPPRMNRYREVSQQIRAIFEQYTPLIEPLSIDEAYLDVTHNYQEIPSATRIAQRIKTQVREETGLTCSAGVSFNKFLAKVASDERKPNGLSVITPEDAPAFLETLPVRKIPGVGNVMQAKLKELGIEIGYQLREKSEAFLVQHFGKVGSHLYQIIRGNDHRPVVTHRERKSISVENTFPVDLSYGDKLLAELQQLSQTLYRRMNRRELSGRTVTLKVKFHDFQQITRATTEKHNFVSAEGIFHAARRKLHYVCQVEFPGKKIRLLGIGISKFHHDTSDPQLNFLHLL